MCSLCSQVEGQASVLSWSWPLLSARVAERVSLFCCVLFLTRTTEIWILEASGLMSWTH